MAFLRIRLLLIFDEERLRDTDCAKQYGAKVGEKPHLGKRFNFEGGLLETRYGEILLGKSGECQSE